MSPKLAKIATRLIELIRSPVTIGLIITITTTSLAHLYYTYKADIEAVSREHSPLFDIIDTVEQKIIDLRFKNRGETIPQEKVAVLAIDDASLMQIERWPWSRDKMAYLVDELMNHGAKVLGFDIIFSEPQVDRIHEVLSEIEKNAEPIPPHLKRAFQEAKSKLSPDDTLTAVLKKHSDKIIQGAYSANDPLGIPPYQEFCRQAIFLRSPSYKLVDLQNIPPIEFKAEYLAPDAFVELLNPIFNLISNEAKDAFLATTKKTQQQLSTREQLALQEQTDHALESYCRAWLTPKDPHWSHFEQNWKMALGQVQDFSSIESADEASRLFKLYNFYNPILGQESLSINTPQLLEVGAHHALFNALLDSDGSIRQYPLVRRRALTYIPSLGLQTFLVAQNLQTHFSLALDKKTGLLEVSEFKIVDPETESSFKVPTDKRGFLRINYAGKQQSYPYLSAVELFKNSDEIQYTQRVLDPETGLSRIESFKTNKKEFIQDRIFVIGATAVGVYDLRITPFDENFPGVETHVNAIGNLLSQNFIHTSKDEPKFMLGALVILGVSLSLLLNYLGALAGLIVTVTSLAAIYLIDRFVLFNSGLIANTSFVALLVGGLYILMTFYKYLTEERKKSHLKATFAKYVSPAIVDEILKAPENIELGGKKQRMSVFFSDVRGFTTISEKLDPQVLSQILNEYLTPMTDIVFKNNGTLDKYMGDAVMAFFGAPIAYPDHAKAACRCALQSIEKLKEIQAQFKERSLPNIDIGIGINTSEMSVGNMGSDIVRNYTVMGDGVNLGSRLEGINKEYGTRIIISEFTYNDVKDQFTAREIDWVRVKGKNEPIKIYELLSEGPPSADFQKLLPHFEQGYKLYHQKMFTEAILEFNKSLEAKPDDPVSQLYIERCQEFLHDPPPENWDGVFVMKTK